MFSEEERTAYLNIKAPDELRNKILRYKKNRVKALYRFGIAAACLVLIATGIIFYRPNHIEINGQRLGNHAIFYDTACISSRTTSAILSIPIEIKAFRQTEISVSHGWIYTENSAPAKQITLSSGATIWWEIEPESTDSILEMTISDQTGVYVVTLTHDNTKLIITKEKQK